MAESACGRLARGRFPSHGISTLATPTNLFEKEEGARGYRLERDPGRWLARTMEALGMGPPSATLGSDEGGLSQQATFPDTLRHQANMHASLGCGTLKAKCTLDILNFLCMALDSAEIPFAKTPFSWFLIIP